MIAHITWKQAERYAFEAVVEHHDTWMDPGRISVDVENTTFRVYKRYLRRLLPIVSNPESEERLILSAKLVRARERFDHGTGYESRIVEVNLDKFRDDPSTVDYIMERCHLPMVEDLMLHLNPVVLQWAERNHGLSTHIL